MTTSFPQRKHFVIQVEALPWPANPGASSGSCAIEAYAAQLLRPPAGHRSPSWTEHQALNERFIKESAPDALATCWFHQQPWGIISDLAVAVLNRVFTSDISVLKAWAEKKGYAPSVVELAMELLGTAAPLKWTPGDTDVDNGQHRVCAMKAQSVAATVVYG